MLQDEGSAGLLEAPMGIFQVPLDHHLIMRLEALAVLQQETLPGLPFDIHDGARQALSRGVDQMLGELLLPRSKSERPN
jgi:hypothetical protein